jgi:CRISPR-associated endonuclease/helicase Cas3
MIRLHAASAYTYDVPFVGDVRPYAHQAVQQRLVQRIFDTGKTAAIWNQAMTGAGKTLANYSYLAKHPRINALGMYPVNELIKDQYQSLQQKLPLKRYQEVALWTAEELRKQRLPRQTVLDVLIEMTQPDYRAILTNPDYVALIMQERLRSYKKGTQAAPFYRVCGGFPLQVFDEFHLYDIAQVNFFMQWIALTRAAFPEKTYAFLFSSATPRADVLQLIQRLGIDVWDVQKEIEHWLLEQNPPVCEERIFLETVDLELKSSYLEGWNTSDSILNDWHEVESYLAEWKSAQPKGLIILDSIHEAQLLAQALRKKGYDVGEVHGLSHRKDSREALARPITVATATVEVGVDFQGDIKKDFLLFEARNAGSFMQRLGRIGRGSEREPIPPRHVWAYVPGYVAEQMKDQREMTREALGERMTAAYQRHERFHRYIEKTGGMNLVHSYHLLKRHQLEREQNPTLNGIKNVTEQLYALSFESQSQQYEEWKKKRILEPAISFRGQNTMESFLYGEDFKEKTFYPDIWFWDETLPEHPLKRYDYGYVLRRRMVRFVERDELVRRVKEHYPESECNDYVTALERDDAMGYAIATGFREKPARLCWYLSDVRLASYAERLIRVNRLKLQSEDPALNAQLMVLFAMQSERSWVVYIPKASVKEVKNDLKLPPFFRLYPLMTSRGAKWSIAFNGEAFQLWSVWEQVKSEVL